MGSLCESIDKSVSVALFILSFFLFRVSKKSYKKKLVFFVAFDACMHTWAFFCLLFYPRIMSQNKQQKTNRAGRTITSINCFRTHGLSARRRCMRSKMGHNV